MKICTCPNPFTELQDMVGSERPLKLCTKCGGWVPKADNLLKNFKVK